MTADTPKSDRHQSLAKHWKYARSNVSRRLGRASAINSLARCFKFFPKRSTAPIFGHDPVNMSTRGDYKRAMLLKTEQCG
jgi:hypothetical protein